jgi:transcriptional regulator with GAF, ATPase, and Fis domain
VLITGESGTGKELLARAIHFSSDRAERAFVVENCGALPDTLLEAELFGHKKGAFTGAHEDRIGLFQQADGGTLFLDEIGDTSPAFQVKLLRALQEGEIRPVGSPRTVPVDVRIIAATNRDLEADVASGRFRRDLYYRIAGIGLHMPSLRERPQDIPLIVGGLFKESALAGRRFSEAALKALLAHRWPGNVRELQNEVMRALALGEVTCWVKTCCRPAACGQGNGRQQPWCRGRGRHAEGSARSPRRPGDRARHGTPQGQQDTRRRGTRPDPRRPAHETGAAWLGRRRGGGVKLLWLQSGGCGGCTLSWLGSEHGSLFRLLADEGIDILWHPSISEACLDDARN